jgi:hypothetical protein
MGHGVTVGFPRNSPFRRESDFRLMMKLRGNSFSTCGRGQTNHWPRRPRPMFARTSFHRKDSLLVSTPFSQMNPLPRRSTRPDPIAQPIFMMVTLREFHCKCILDLIIVNPMLQRGAPFYPVGCLCTEFGPFSQLKQIMSISKSEFLDKKASA